MKKICLIALLFVETLNCKAQMNNLNNLNGTSIQVRDISDVNGSPFLYDEWKKGTVTLENDNVYKDLDIKYDMFNDNLFFKNGSQETLAFAIPVKEFIINDGKNGSGTMYKITFRKGYQSIPGITINSYLEVLGGNGKVQILKRVTKRIQQENVYPNTSINKHFIQSKKYYLFALNKGTLIKNDEKSILAILSDKKSELADYVKEKNLNLKEDADIDQLLIYYNSLAK